MGRLKRRHNPPNIYLFKVIYVVLVFLLLTMFTVSIFDFEQVNVSWVSSIFAKRNFLFLFATTLKNVIDVIKMSQV